MNVYVIPATKNRSGWMVAARTGDVITHTRLEARDIDVAAAEAQRNYPTATVITPKKGTPS